MDIVWADEISLPERNRMLGEWCGSIIGRPLMGPYSTMGVIDKGEIIAVVLYHNWDEQAAIIEMSAASTTPRWLARPVLKSMFEYPFDELGCQMVVLRVSEHNRRMRGIAKRFGFVEHRIPRLRGREEAEIILTLTVEDWRSNGYGR